MLACDNTCSKYCYDVGTQSCTCNLASGKFWLRRTVDPVTPTLLKTYCERKIYLKLIYYI